jgi:hypothetical protein
LTKRVRGRKNERPVLKPFGRQNRSCPIENQQLQTIPAFRPEDEDIAAVEEIAVRSLFGHRDQAVDATAKIDRPRGDQDLAFVAKSDHPAPQRRQHDRQRVWIDASRNAHQRAPGLNFNHPARRQPGARRLTDRVAAHLGDRHWNKKRSNRLRRFVSPRPGFLAPRAQQAAIHAMSAGDRRDVSAGLEALHQNPRPFVAAPPPHPPTCREISGLP